MSGRRSNIEIIGDILRLGKTGKTDILYGCDLSYYQLQKYLSFLVARGFLQMDGHASSRKRYKPTANGEQLLSHIDRLKAILGLPDRDADTYQVEADGAAFGAVFK